MEHSFIQAFFKFTSRTIKMAYSMDMAEAHHKEERREEVAIVADKYHRPAAS
jgi:hypothetical protein